VKLVWWMCNFLSWGALAKHKIASLITYRTPHAIISVWSIRASAVSLWLLSNIVKYRLFSPVTGHKPPDITLSRSESPVQSLQLQGFPVTENGIVHCVLILQGVKSWRFRPALPVATDRVFWPRGYVRGGYVRQSLAPRHGAVYLQSSNAAKW